MMFKLWGAVLIIAGCGCFGFLIASAYKQEVISLQRLIFALEQMKNELQFRSPPLPDLCRHIASTSRGQLSGFFAELSNELESQVRPDAQSCVNAVLLKYKEIPSHTHTMILALGSTLGRYDLEGQLRGLDALHCTCTQKLTSLTNNQETRLRSYRTLGLCAGAAMAILFI